MTPAQLNEFGKEYRDGTLPDVLLAAKWKLTPEAFNHIVRVGWGTIFQPQPFTRKPGMDSHTIKGTQHSSAVTRIAKDAQLMPADMALSPLEETAMLSARQRYNSYSLTAEELEFCNMVLRGTKTGPAAAACFEIYDKMEALRKGSSLLRDQRITAYIEALRGQNLYAPVRGRAYLEAVLWQVIDRSAELQQEYDINGQPMTGRCTYAPKPLIAAAALLMRLKGWDNTNATDTATESHVERLRRINMNKKKD